MFNEYPYTDLHNLNLDWFLDQFKKIGKHIEDLKKMVLRAPDATNANAGQTPIADGQGGWAWGEKTISRADTVSAVVTQAGGSFTAIDKVVTNSSGQVTSVNLKTVGLPSYGDVIIDSTLTQSGQAADAKATGDAINEVKADLDDVEEVASDVSQGLVLYKSNNLFNMSNASDGYLTADGVFHSGSSYFVSDFIEVSENDVITFYTFTHTYTSNARTAIGARFVCAYDANKNPVTASGSGSTISSYTVPSGIKYIRCSLAIAYKTKKPYIAKNAVPTAYTIGFEDKLVQYGQAGNHAYIYNCDSTFWNKTFELPTMSLCKNVIYSFTGFVSSLGLDSFKLSIGHGSDHFGSTWIEIDKDNVYWHIYTSTDAVYTFPHSLPFDTVATGFISISIITNDNTKATLKINYGETEYTKTLGFYGFSDQAFFVKAYVITIKNAVFSVTCKDFDAPVFVFGDSYTAIIESTSKWTHYLVADGFGDKICLNAFPGADSAELASAFANTLKVATPQKILWCLGMNDGSDTDESTPNQQWLSNVTNMLNVCRQKNIEPIFLTIPTVPSVYNEGKNTWIRTSQYRFADVALALGADGTGAWGSGMLSTDNVHPTPYGAKTIYSKIMSDLPDIFV